RRARTPPSHRRRGGARPGLRLDPGDARDGADGGGGVGGALAASRRGSLGSPWVYRGGIILKAPGQIEKMAAAGAIQARCLRMLRSKCRPGVTTDELDAAAAKFIASQGAEASFLGYRGFPKSVCAS